MEELEQALAEYLQSMYRVGDEVTVRQLRNEVASKHLSEKLTFTDAMSVVTQFVRMNVIQGILQRVGSGRYLYLPDGSGVDSAIARYASPSRDLVGFADGQLETGNLWPFGSVSALALSPDFIVERGIADIDLDDLQGISF